MNWREIFRVFSGFHPPFEYLPPAFAAITLFAVVLTVCFTMHRLSQLLPQNIRVLAQDFFKTLACCTYPFGLIILRRYHGDFGYLFCNVPLNTATSLILSAGEASPIAHWLLFIKGKQTVSVGVVRAVVQVTAALSAYRFGKLLMTLDLHPSFAENLSSECQSALNVPVIVGFLIELFGTTWDSIFHSLHLHKNVIVDRLLKFTNSCLGLCLVGHWTGLFREPAKAIGMTFGCGNIGAIQHLFVYFLGPLVGSYVAYRIKPTIGPVVSDNVKLRVNTQPSQGHMNNRKKIKKRSYDKVENKKQS